MNYYMLKRFIILFSSVLVATFSCRNQEQALSQNENSLNKYNVIWDTPGNDHTGSMPLGNGDIGLNLWVEENGDLCFFISKTDAWCENGRLVKVGKLRVKTDPVIMGNHSEFKQELDLLTGTIKINVKGLHEGRNADISLFVRVDANHPVIHVKHESSIPVKLSAAIELWRNEPYPLPEESVSDLLESRDKPDSLVLEEAIVDSDEIITGGSDYIGWYHHNRRSAGFEFTNKLQGLSEYFSEDPLLQRTFGAIVRAPDAVRTSDLNLETESGKSGRIDVYVLTTHPSQPEEWQKLISQLAEETEKAPFRDREKAHLAWWKEFWDRSWIHATGSDATDQAEQEKAFTVSRAYTLQRFMEAASGRGAYPIKFNGSIFTVPAEGTSGDPDYRRWGPGYWWQNTRLPYLSMCAAGDYDLMQPFLKMYAGDIYDLCKYRTNKYFGFDGAFYPECMYFWGPVFTADYGWTPFEEREDPLQVSGWHKWEWVAGPELVFMMLDYYDYTGDETFLTSKIIPLANDVIKFFDNYYTTGESGKWVMHPSQSLETWWDCTNPLPELAGLQSITRRLLGLSAQLTGEQNRQFWETMRLKIPEIPVRETPSGTALAPAERFEDKRNVENPEMYAVFPFRLFSFEQPNAGWAVNALEHRWDMGSFGWRQDDIFMAYLGLTDQAKEFLVNRAATYDKKSRFPAFWGPNYDWVPDQDHGGVLMKAFQSMLMQADPYSQKVYLLPAWPENWNAEFKLHAPHKTVISGKIVNGKMEEFQVIPESRKNDIIVVNNN
jgi:alpha-L-fucosidase 2